MTLMDASSLLTWGRLEMQKANVCVQTDFNNILSEFNVLMKRILNNTISLNSISAAQQIQL